MPDLPPPAEAIAAVAAHFHAATCRAASLNAACDGATTADFELARFALAAALPYLRAQAYAEIRQLATDTGAIVTCHTPETDDGVNIRLTHTHPFADLIGDPP